MGKNNLLGTLQRICREYDLPTNGFLGLLKKDIQIDDDYWSLMEYSTKLAKTKESINQIISNQKRNHSKYGYKQINYSQIEKYVPIIAEAEELMSEFKVKPKDRKKLEHILNSASSVTLIHPEEITIDPILINCGRLCGITSKYLDRLLNLELN